MANTGYKAFSLVESYYVGDGVATGFYKNNVVGDPDYVAPIYDIVTCPLADTTPPSTPSSPVYIGGSTSSITLAWTASTDNAAVAGYSIAVTGVGTFTTAGTDITIDGLSAGTVYDFNIYAYDTSNNFSAALNVQFGTLEDVNTLIEFQSSYITVNAYSHSEQCEVLSNYTELNFLSDVGWVSVYPSGNSGNLTLDLYIQANDGYNASTRYATVMAYNYSTYLGSIIIEQGYY